MCNLGAIGFHGVLPGAPVSTLLAPRMAPKKRGSRRSADIRLGWPSPGALLAPESVAADDTFEAPVRKLVPAFAAPPFPLPSRAFFAAARSGQGRAGRARRKRTLDGEDRRGTLAGKGKGARASAGAAERGGAPIASARGTGGVRVEEPCARDIGFPGDDIRPRSRKPVR
jgi:hypothetical protein